MNYDRSEDMERVDYSQLVGSPSDPSSIINIIWPYEPTTDDEIALEDIRDFEAGKLN